MPLERDEIRTLARLARLAMTDDELRTVTDDLSRIVAFVERLQKVDTEGVEPMAHPLGDLVQRLREDVVDHEDRHDRFQADAPRVEDALYLVPKVIE